MKIDAKDLTIHGMGTSYKISTFKFDAQGSEILQRSGFGTKPPFNPYIGIIVWGPDSKLIIDTPKGFAPSAVEKANLDNCCVLIVGVQKILDTYDYLEDGDNIEISRKGRSGFYVKVSKGFVW